MRKGEILDTVHFVPNLKHRGHQVERTLENLRTIVRGKLGSTERTSIAFLAGSPKGTDSEIAFEIEGIRVCIWLYP